jgi:hypothetical protein
LLLGLLSVIGPACHKGMSAMNSKNEGVAADRRIEKLRDRHEFQ